jgi:hypothetical protein
MLIIHPGPVSQGDKRSEVRWSVNTAHQAPEVCEEGATEKQGDASCACANTAYQTP